VLKQTNLQVKVRSCAQEDELKNNGKIKRRWRAFFTNKTKKRMERGKK